jgi:hypothetical protein
MPKYYATRVVDPKLFTPNLCNIPHDYHIAADYLQCWMPPLYLNHLSTQSEANDWDDKIADIMKRSVWYEEEGMDWACIHGLVSPSVSRVVRWGITTTAV